MPEEMWRGLWATSDDSTFRRLLKTRRRFLESGLPDSTTGLPTEEHPATAKQIMRDHWRRYNRITPFFEQYRVQVKDKEGFPPPPAVWDDGVWEPGPVTQEDCQFLDAMGSELPAKAVAAVGLGTNGNGNSS